MNLAATLTNLLADQNRVHASLAANLTPNGLFHYGMDGLVASYLAPRIETQLRLARMPERPISDFEILEQWVKDAGQRVRKNSGRLPNDPNERLNALIRRTANERELAMAQTVFQQYVRWMNDQDAATPAATN